MSADERLHFDRTEALKAKLQRDLPPCPACGAPATQEFEAWGGDPIPVGLAECSVECWKVDPDRYLKATAPPPKPPKPPANEPLPTKPETRVRSVEAVMNREPFLLPRFAALAVIGGLIWMALGAAALWVWEAFA